MWKIRFVKVAVPCIVLVEYRKTYREASDYATHRLEDKQCPYDYAWVSEAPFTRKAGKSKKETQTQTEKRESLLNPYLLPEAMSKCINPGECAKAFDEGCASRDAEVSALKTEVERITANENLSL